ncbi:MAG: phosphatase PAP2 family protein [Gammaproteobacteria bacterium]|nr:phosphatase PAP2 family protein [Gammaproteobacteria bacterium]
MIRRQVDEVFRTLRIVGSDSDTDSIALAILVGVSRLILQMHYLSDVLFGALIGTLVPLWVKVLLFNGR